MENKSNMGYNKLNMNGIEIVCLYVIVNFGLGSKVLKIAKQNGVRGGTICLGKGTVKNKILELLDLTDIRKEIVIMVAEKNIGFKALEALNHELQFQKPNHGIAFCISVTGFYGTRGYSNVNYCNSDNKEIQINIEDRGEKNIMYNAIYVVVDKGKAEEVIDAATKAGSKGGTIINGRGAGIHETSKLFAMEIEPEKEIVLILAETSTTEQIVSSIWSNLKMDEPGNGIIFVQDVIKTYGIR